MLGIQPAFSGVTNDVACLPWLIHPELTMWCALISTSNCILILLLELPHVVACIHTHTICDVPSPALDSMHKDLSASASYACVVLHLSIVEIIRIV